MASMSSRHDRHQPGPRGAWFRRGDGYGRGRVVVKDGRLADTRWDGLSGRARRVGLELLASM